MSFHTEIHSPKGNIFQFYALYVVYVFNDRILKSKTLEAQLWDLIKCELFYIGGACQHSGNCCRNIMIVHQGNAVNTMEKYEKLKLEIKKYERFTPHQASKNMIRSYNCNALTNDNMCSKYDTRPQFCKNYPMSSFLQFNTIKKGCGFSIQRRDISPKIWNKHLQMRIQQVESVNKNK